MSLFARIFILIALALLLATGGVLFNGLGLRQQRLEHEREDVMQLAKIANADIDRVLEGTRQLLATLAKLPAPHGWDERACTVVEAVASSDFEYDHLAAVDLGGSIQCSSSGAARVGMPMPDRVLFERVVATAGFSVGTYGVGATSGNNVIRVGYPLVDDAGAVVGVIYAGINVTWLNTAIAGWKLGEGVSIAITDRNGIIVACYPQSGTVGQPISDNLKPFLFKPAVATTEAMAADGVATLYGYSPLHQEGNDLAAFVGRPQGPILADINRSIWLNLAAVLTGLALSAGLAVIYVRRFLERPFQALLAVVGRWRVGDWSARTGTASGVPEFDQMSLAFNAMAEEVSAQILRREIADQAKMAGLERFRLIFESVSDAIFVVNPETGAFMDVNDAGCAMFGLTHDELIGTNIGTLSTGVAPYTQADAIPRLGTGQSAPFEWHCKAKDGHLFWSEVSLRGTVLEGRPVGLAILRDMTERKRRHEEVTHQAHSDTLTGLPNRLDFDATLEQEIARCRRYDRPLCMAIGDIDHFKLVNDTFGHPAGDVVLKTLARLMRKSLRTADYISRWGGEEFTILLPETKLDDAEELLNRLRVSISDHVIPEIGRAVTLSFGVTACTKSDSPGDLLERVDRALYTSKETGRNKVTKLRRSRAEAHSPDGPSAGTKV